MNKFTLETVNQNDNHTDVKKEIKQVSKARKEQDKLLEQMIIDYQSGNTGVFNDIYNIYKPKFERLSYRMNDEDIIQELGIALFRAVQTFKTNMPAKFNTYFWTIAQNHIGTLAIKNNAIKRTAPGGMMSLNQLVNIDGSDVEIGDLIEDEKFGQKFEDAMFRAFLCHAVYPYLKTAEIKILKLFLKGYTLKEIGNRLDCVSAPAVYVKIQQLKSKEIIYKHICKYFGKQ